MTKKKERKSEGTVLVMPSLESRLPQNKVCSCGRQIPIKFANEGAESCDVCLHRAEKLALMKAKQEAVAVSA